jgi:hypothetical protein
MAFLGMFPWHPPANSVWRCPHPHCDYEEPGDPDNARGAGLCKRKSTRQHPPQRLVKKADPDIAGTLREVNQEGL